MLHLNIMTMVTGAHVQQLFIQDSSRDFGRTIFNEKAKIMFQSAVVPQGTHIFALEERRLTFIMRRRQGFSYFLVGTKASFYSEQISEAAERCHQRGELLQIFTLCFSHF